LSDSASKEYDTDAIDIAKSTHISPVMQHKQHSLPPPDNTVSIFDLKCTLHFVSY